MAPMSRVTPLSGFPEWSPSDRFVEASIIMSLREVFALHGFAEIETRAVEPVSRLAGDSEASKEIYALSRLNADSKPDAALGLHFDLTVPLARYVEEHAEQPRLSQFRRYQIQKVWRGEHPKAAVPRVLSGGHRHRWSRCSARSPLRQRWRS